MFHCERCRSSFNATVAAAAFNCPRCRGRDGIEAPLRFKLFEPSAMGVAESDAGAIDDVEEAGSPDQRS